MLWLEGIESGVYGLPVEGFEFRVYGVELQGWSLGFTCFGIQGLNIGARIWCVEKKLTSRGKPAGVAL